MQNEFQALVQPTADPRCTASLPYHSALFLPYNKTKDLQATKHQN